MGIQDDKGFVISISVASIIHHSVAALSLSSSMLSAGFSLKMALFPLICFSCSCSVGVAIGMLFMAHMGTLLNSILTSIAAGTFVYVSCTEILQREFDNKKTYKWLQYTCVVLGGALIIGLWFIEGGHSHGDGEVHH